MKEDVLRRHAVRVSGPEKQPILFAHGFGCDQTMWRYVVPAFEKQYRVVTFDYLGSGNSDVSAYDPEQYSNLAGYADDIVEIIKALHLDNVILVGHSVSSMVIALVAKKVPELIANLILVVPSARYVNDPPHYKGGFTREDLEGLLDLMQKNYLGWASFLAPLVMKNDERPELKRELEESFCRADPKIAQQFAEVTFLSDNRTDLKGIETPTLILQCTEDSIAPPSAVEYVHSRLSHSTLHHMKATGHCPHMSHPTETIDAIVDYLSNISPIQRGSARYV